MSDNNSATSTTSFINTSGDCASKPPLSSDSSLDSGCSTMTMSDSIPINQHSGIPSKPVNTMAVSIDQRRRDGPRINLSMLPPQPLVPPPPPPSQLQEAFYDNSSIYNERTSMIRQPSSQSDNSIGVNNSNVYPENYYATYAQSSLPTTNPNIDTLQSSPSKQSISPQSNKFQQSLTQRSSTSSLESASSVPLMPMNVKGMLLHGLPSDEVMRNWLLSIKCDEHVHNFIYHGYDMHLVSRMTPQDLAAVGCKSPALRKKLLSEIKKLNLDYEIPETDPSISLDQWLELLKLSQYHAILLAEGYDTVEKVCKLAWEDLEEIGITKLGHQKRLLLGIDKIQKSAKQQDECQNDNPIYDVHPNHRVSLNGSYLDGRVGTLGRVRSGFFQTRSGANLDHRGLPVATVMPALKHVNSPILQAENNQQILTHGNDSTKSKNSHIKGTSATNGNNFTPSTNGQPIYDSQNNNARFENLTLNDLASSNTITRKNPPPPPPVRTNSLKVTQGDGYISQPVYGINYGPQNGAQCVGGSTNSTSFLRTPKLGTLTATTNKMLASGGHIQTIPAGHTNSNTKIVPVREAPLPPVSRQHLPYQQNLLQTTIAEKIDEEPSTGSVLPHQQQQPDTYPMLVNCDATGPPFVHVIGNQLGDVSEFPPPPPCQ